MTGGPRSFVVRNTGATAITDLAITTTDPAFTTATVMTGTACGTTLAAGASCVVGVSYTPQGASTSRGALSITGGGHAAFASLAAAGLPIVEVIARDSAPASGSTFDFGTQTIGGDPPDDAYVTILVHDPKLYFLAYAESYGTPPQFDTLRADCGGGARPEVPCTLRLRFAPTSSGVQSGGVALLLSTYLDDPKDGEHVQFPLTLTGTGAP
jgi:hypothetical protein